MMSHILYDAVIVLSGGLTPEGVPLDFVKLRLDTALPYIGNSSFVILNSRGTPHKPPFLNRDGFPVDESVASADYLVETLGVNTGKILLDSTSMDTIGNAFFALLHFVIPRAMRRVVVVTSEFHMPRSRVIFEHVFSLWDNGKVQLKFVSSPDKGIKAESLHARVLKEQESLRKYEALAKNIPTIPEMAAFIFSTHGAYAYKPRADRVVTVTNSSLLDSY